jgi:hypothetical protein
VVPVVSVRGQIAELSGSLALATGLALAATVLWSALGHGSVTRTDVLEEFFLTVATCWAVLIPAKVWNNHRGDSWARRVVMMVLGLGIGAGALWLDGWPAPLPAADISLTTNTAAITPVHLFAGHVQSPNVAGYLSYFALAMFSLRWWKLADRRRAHRFSFAPILAAGFWGLILLVLWQEPWRGTLVLATTAAIVQLVSPWEQPAPPPARRMRLRYA